jgi:hypothetical protein
LGSSHLSDTLPGRRDDRAGAPTLPLDLRVRVCRCPPSPSSCPTSREERPPLGVSI